MGGRLPGRALDPPGGHPSDLSLAHNGAVAENVIAAFGAFLTGVAALVTAMQSLRVQKRNLNAECDQRIREIIDAFYRGTKMQPRDEGMEERWSHLE